MSSLTHPVGPQRPGVYWRRRVSLLLVVLVLVALAVFALTRAGGDDAAASPSADQDVGQQVAGPEATQTPTPTDAPAEPCAGEQLQVVATADAGSYAAGTTPELGVTVRNTGTKECTVDLGADAVELLVVSGEDRIWSSRDCQDAADASVVTVEAQGEQAVAVAWPRQRSAQGCPSDLAEPRAGTYQLTGTVGGTASAPVSFALE